MLNLHRQFLKKVNIAPAVGLLTGDIQSKGSAGLPQFARCTHLWLWKQLAGSCLGKGERMAQVSMKVLSVLHS